MAEAQQTPLLKSISRDVYITHVDCAGKKVIRRHAVWDFDRFLAARIKDCTDMNDQQDPGLPRKACVLPATEAEYFAQIKK